MYKTEKNKCHLSNFLQGPFQYEVWNLTESWTLETKSHLVLILSKCKMLINQKQDAYNKT